ncbi:nuclease-related domain-containing protein [Aquisalimonas sp.]|uniref:nuclease-related domain-containing protein n=1 Tax=Aquisalimonas sp. TaxID=1872621 RepID=UPI0025BD7617|nr:nuclease-related domain-containing protein [Aquisalimonas sp.]
MIVKEAEPYSATANGLTAGNNQEQNVAFLLRSEFENAQFIRVINDLTISHGNESAQIDHLVIHRYGFIVIESKGLCGEFKVDTKGEWWRCDSGRWRSMPSPVRQAELKQDLLKDFLGRHVKKFLGRILGIQMRVGGRDWQALCALSSNTIFHRDGMSEAISSKIVETESLGNKVRLICSPTGGGELNGKPWFSEQEMANVSHFLLEHHRGNTPEVAREMPQSLANEQNSCVPG